MGCAMLRRGWVELHATHKSTMLSYGTGRVGEHGAKCRLPANGQRGVGGGVALHAVEGLAYVGQNVLHIFNAHAQTNEVGGYAGLAQLLVAELAVRVAGGV